jgi:hypothetical protein
MLFYILLFVIFCFGVLAFFFIKDLLSIINYIQFQRKIKIYNKKYKKYLEDKKHLLDKRLEHEKEIRKQYGMEFGSGLEEEQEYIVGFVKPIGKHSNQEFMKNAPKYAKIVSMMKHLGSKGIKSAYWRILTNTAHKIAGLENDQEIKMQQKKSQDLMKEREKNQGSGRSR